jgi:hypothetical protein
LFSLPPLPPLAHSRTNTLRTWLERRQLGHGRHDLCVARA